MGHGEVGWWAVKVVPLPYVQVWYFCGSGTSEQIFKVLFRGQRSFHCVTELSSSFFPLIFKEIIFKSFLKKQNETMKRTNIQRRNVCGMCVQFLWVGCGTLRFTIFIRWGRWRGHPNSEFTSWLGVYSHLPTASLASHTKGWHKIIHSKDFFQIRCCV